jgi:HopA1 effector protein family
LYADKRHLVSSKPALLRIYKQMKSSSFKLQTPLLAKRMAPGVALAEDPNNGESFGQHRSRLLAEALYAAYEKGSSSTAQKIAEIEGYFGGSRLNILTAYLNPGSTDDYDTVLKGVFD